MKRIVAALAICMLAACGQEKTGYVDTAQLVKDYQEMKDVEANFKVKGEKFSQKRDSISRAFQIEEQAFQQKAQKMNQKKAQEEYQVLAQRVQLVGQQLQAEQQRIQQEGQTKIDSVISKVKDFIKTYGKDNGYTYILGSNEAGSVLYGKEDKDLTETILKALNEAYKN